MAQQKVPKPTMKISAFVRTIFTPLFVILFLFLLAQASSDKSAKWAALGDSIREQLALAMMIVVGLVMSIWGVVYSVRRAQCKPTYMAIALIPFVLVVVLWLIPSVRQGIITSNPDYQRAHTYRGVCSPLLDPVYGYAPTEFRVAYEDAVEHACGDSRLTEQEAAQLKQLKSELEAKANEEMAKRNRLEWQEHRRNAQPFVRHLAALEAEGNIREMCEYTAKNLRAITFSTPSGPKTSTARFTDEGCDIIYWYDAKKGVNLSPTELLAGGYLD